MDLPEGDGGIIPDKLNSFSCSEGSPSRSFMGHNILDTSDPQAE